MFLRGSHCFGEWGSDCLVFTIITSRQAGFRVVANSLKTYCDNYAVSVLNDLEIRELSLKWHKAIIDDSENTLKEANKLSDIILRDSRILALAENPLLLTTLLFVKRWAGYLPTKRTLLYQEMIKLLLVTWNVEGHDMLDIEEAEPQLCFVAYCMTKNGQQTISSAELARYLIDARIQMPAILGYTNVSPTDFIRLVESRSSLLTMIGHKQYASGELLAVYEFLHLSFQEYLTAKAIVKKYIPLAETDLSDIEIIKDNLFNENWKEVIPLIAVLLERESKLLVEFLINQSKLLNKTRANEGSPKFESVVTLLGNCIANEVQITPDLLVQAIETFSKNHDYAFSAGSLDIILKNKYGIIFREKVNEFFFEKYYDSNAFNLGGILAEIVHSDFSHTSSVKLYLEFLLEKIKNGDKKDKCLAILGMMQFSFENSKNNKLRKGDLKLCNCFFETMLNVFNHNDKHFKFVSSWCIAWAGEAGFLTQKLKYEYANIFLNLWISSREKNLQYTFSWALSRILVPDFPKENIKNVKLLKSFLADKILKKKSIHDELVAYYILTIIDEPVSSEVLIDFFKNKTLLFGINKGKSSSIFLFAEVWGIDLQTRKFKINSKD